MAERQSRVWFRAKRFGYGSGLPVAWQGWAVLALFLAAMIGAPLVLAPTPAILVSLVAILLFCLICARTTDGGWRWRWGP